MKHKWLLSILFLLLFSEWGLGQISPGDLSKAHSDLEGMSNCTHCHELGRKVLNSKCLDCHKDIRQLINERRGYHASSEVKNKDCFNCHSEHHGVKFDMVRFDEKNFDHQLTGYELEDKHAVIDCRKCHQPDNIANSDIKKRKDTYLGLGKACLSCHEDFHQKSLGNDCKECHDFKKFRPATGFDHNEAKFKLNGKHLDVECKKCHKTDTKNGKDFQHFTNLSFADCKSCHRDPHQNHLPGKCVLCHSENSFKNFAGKRRFDHNVTRFTLKGKHKKIDCFDCHKNTKDPKQIFQDQLGVDQNDCTHCHEDVHENKFGSECAQCHDEKSFTTLKTTKFFKHDRTDYPLKGKHVEVDCKKCHIDKFTTAIDFSNCNNCHEDYHKGEFSELEKASDCASCHSLEAGFEVSLYSFDRHQKTEFPLEGSHLATPCFACHLDESSWTFKDLSTQCIGCHDDEHKGKLSEKYYPDQQCNHCHQPESWAAIEFNHQLTEWPLEGQHLKLECRKCHLDTNNNTNSKELLFNYMSSDCRSCHQNVHGSQFQIKGITDCTRCHTANRWQPDNFDHNTTAFPLEGRHAEIDCEQCHNKEGESEIKNIIYKIEKFECIDCHL